VGELLALDWPAIGMSVERIRVMPRRPRRCEFTFFFAFVGAGSRVT